tara:strand:- start:100 stop:915 length:816 start_codon:yes stop_codon:yes gene_type:complete
MKFKKKLKEIFFFYKYNILRKLRIIFNIDQTLEINNKKLILPPDHLLSFYHKIYPSYDKYLENFIKDKNNLNIIDIGANVGDTLLRILSDNNNYFCIEPNDYFLKYLKINVSNNINLHKNTNIKIINDLVGEELEGFLDDKNGTATLTKETKKPKIKKKYSKKLDQIILLNKIGRVDIIKSDTDGYDINVLKSGFETIKKDKPILFFEYLNIQSTQLIDYINFISELKFIGYNKFIIIDNYGEILLQSNNIDKIKEIMNNRNIVDIFCSIN